MRRIYTTFILGMALLNFGTRVDNFGHGPLDFCRVNTNFSEVVSARLKRGPRAETRNILAPRAFKQMTDHKSEGSGVENEPSTARKRREQRQSFCLLTGKKDGDKKVDDGSDRHIT